MVLTRNLGLILLAIWLILNGLVVFVPVIASIAGFPIIMAIIAVVAGVLLLVGK